MKKVDRGILKTGFFAGTIGILCCVSPVILVLFGLSSVSAAIALGNNLFDNYKIYFISSSVLFLFGAFYFQLKKKNQCSLSGVRKNINTFIVTIFLAVLVYIFWFYFTSWLEIVFGGS
jgi:hypothetical protein